MEISEKLLWMSLLLLLIPLGFANAQMNLPQQNNNFDFVISSSTYGLQINATQQVAHATIGLGLASGLPQPVMLSCSGIPASEGSCQINPSAVTPTGKAQLVISYKPVQSYRSFNFTITGTYQHSNSRPLTHSIQIHLNIYPAGHPEKKDLYIASTAYFPPRVFPDEQITGYFNVFNPNLDPQPAKLVMTLISFDNSVTISDSSAETVLARAGLNEFSKSFTIPADTKSGLYYVAFSVERSDQNTSKIMSSATDLLGLDVESKITETPGGPAAIDFEIIPSQQFVSLTAGQESEIPIKVKSVRGSIQGVALTCAGAEMIEGSCKVSPRIITPYENATLTLEHRTVSSYKFYVVYVTGTYFTSSGNVITRSTPIQLFVKPPVLPTQTYKIEPSGRISNYQIDSGLFSPGNDVFTSVNVTNTGTKVHQYTLSFYVTDPNWKVWQSQRTSVLLNPDETKSIELSWGIPRSAAGGPYDATIDLLGSQQGGDLYRPYDHIRQVNAFQVQSLPPGYQMTMSAKITKYSIDSGSFAPGSDVTAHVDVTNGGEKADRFYIGYSVHDPRNNWIETPHSSLFLQAQQTGSASLSWNVPFGAAVGPYDARIFVREYVSEDKEVGPLDEVDKPSAFEVKAFSSSGVGLSPAKSLSIDNVAAKYYNIWGKYRLSINGHVGQVRGYGQFLEPVRIYVYDLHGKQLFQDQADVDEEGNFAFIRGLDDRVFVPGTKFFFEVTYNKDTIKTSGTFTVEQNKSEVQANLQQPPLAIPSWIKNDAKWWSSGQIGDDEFVKGVQYLIEQGMINVPKTQYSVTQSHVIPVWVKSNAGWWAKGQISDGEFVKAIQYLIENGIIRT